VSQLPQTTFAALRDDVHEVSFRPDAGGARRIGAEVELLAVDDATDRPLPLGGESRGLIALLRRYGASRRWLEIPGYGSVSRFAVCVGATISFEPGGQLELSSAPAASPSSLIAALRDTLVPLRAALADEGVRLEPVGIDPYNDARAIPLQLDAERYRRMTAYFESIGPYGIRMMRQTAALQLSVDRGGEPAARWRLLNDLAPYLIAIFANSPHYLGADTGHRSYRAHCWRSLDRSRTGVAVADDDPAAAYTRFALSAHEMLRPTSHQLHRSFENCLSDGVVTTEAWREHLTTLFPEVRPRGHFEVRSCDAIGLEWIAVPIVLVYGLTYDAHAAREAALLAGESLALLRSAGVDGLEDTSIARTSRDLFQLAIDGARRLGPDCVSPSDIDVARTFYATYTGRARSPADDRVLRARDTESISTARSR
jgi:Gamma-glutamylcysteine synthetase